jgi:hypothetical protein
MPPLEIWPVICFLRVSAVTRLEYPRQVPSKQSDPQVVEIEANSAEFASISAVLGPDD